MSTLKQRFEEMIHLEWNEFVALESSDETTIDDVVLCSLVRACADTNETHAIKLAFDRIDGLMEIPIEIKVPKFYTRYPNAKELEGGQKKIEASEDVVIDPEEDTYDPASAKLRDTLKKMRDMPRDAVSIVLQYKAQIDKGGEAPKNPMVKSVIVANLLRNVANGKFKAIELVFDQIDGKLTRTITLLGGHDIYVDDYSITSAPGDSMLGEDKVYYSENKLMTTTWLRGFAQNQKGLEILAEGLDEDRE